MSPGNRPCHFPTPVDHSCALGGGRGEVGLGPSFISFPPRLLPNSDPGGSSGEQKRGSMVVSRTQTRFHISQFYTETHNKGMKDLSESATPSNPGLAVVGPSYLPLPTALPYRGGGAGLFSFSQEAQQKCHVNQREHKDTHSTSRLGVSRR